MQLSHDFLFFSTERDIYDVTLPLENSMEKLYVFVTSILIFSAESDIYNVTLTSGNFNYFFFLLQVVISMM